MTDHARFDQRRYPVVGAREGYDAWARTYESTVPDLLDLAVFQRLETPVWPGARVAELACGTGRVGAWLRDRGVARLDGIDGSAAMLDKARDKGLYDSLAQADVGATGLEGAAYDRVVMSLADEHLPTLGPVYREAARLSAPSGQFALVGFHPFFLMLGVPTHFDSTDAGPVSIQSYVYLFSDHVAAAHQAGWRLAEAREHVIDDAWIAAKPKWDLYRDRPISYGLVWAR